jgi:hypothetical protein
MLARNRYGAVVVAAGTLEGTLVGTVVGTVTGTVVEVGTVV